MWCTVEETRENLRENAEKRGEKYYFSFYSFSVSFGNTGYIVIMFLIFYPNGLLIENIRVIRKSIQL